MRSRVLAAAVVATALVAAAIVTAVVLGRPRLNAQHATPSAEVPPVAHTLVAAGTPPATYVGSALCGSCHAEQASAWQRSHHAQAMQTASARTVLGHFDNVSYAQGQQRARFFRSGERFMVRTDGADDRPHEFEVRYTFGVYPLQQYLIETGHGHLQALNIAWDARPQAAGGQRWYSLEPGVTRKARDPLHWMGREHNWNFMCSACHSTHVERRYQPAEGSYNTRWSEISVGCEACHGPGSRHVDWARGRGRAVPDRGAGIKGNGIAGIGTAGTAGDKGLTVELNASRQLRWGLWSSSQRIASAQGPLPVAQAQSERCFPCHARRQALSDVSSADSEWLDDYAPELIQPGIYHADGQIDGEDFEFGSFVQSKMYAHGVTCTNCHDAHSLRLKADGNALCTQCHRAGLYDRSEHSHHAAGSEGARCIACHMPTKTYMGVDVRRDHSFRLPRPRLSSGGVPNACNACHRERSVVWAAAQIAQWTGQRSLAGAEFAPALDAAWAGADAVPLLLQALAHPAPPSPFVRASLLNALNASPTSQTPAEAAIAQGTSDPDALVRFGAARSLSALAPERAAAVGAPLLRDSRRAVRIEAARSLAGLPAGTLAVPRQQDFNDALAELERAEHAADERPESHVNLAQVYARLGREDDVQRELQTALARDPRFVPAMLELAEFERRRHDEDAAARWLQAAWTVAPDFADVAHARGLLEVRRRQRAQAVIWLGRAVRLAPENARYTYVYALALSEAGESAQAEQAVAEGLRRSPRDVSLQELSREFGRLR